MSAKKKPPADWISCSQCNSMFTKTYEKCHQSCRVDNSAQAFSLTDVSIPAIVDGRLVGLATFSPIDPRLPSTSMVNLIGVHPATMKVLGWTVKQQLLISSSCGKAVCVPWPCQTIRLEEMALSSLVAENCKVTEKCLLVASKVSSVSSVAKVLTLTPRTALNFKPDAAFVDYAVSILDDVVFLQDTVLPLSYLGRNLLFSMHSPQSLSDQAPRSPPSVDRVSSTSCRPCDLLYDSLVDKVSSDLMYLDIDVDRPHRAGSETACSTPQRALFSSPSSQLTDSYPSLEMYRVDSSITRLRVSESHCGRSDKRPAIPWSQLIGGLDKEVRMLTEALELPRKYPQFYAINNLIPTRGILVHGPPGTGKTLLVRATAEHAGVFLQEVHGTELLSRHPDPEQHLRCCFDDARNNAPSLVLLDDVDVMCPKRDEAVTDIDRRVAACILMFFDELIMDTSVQVLVVGTTSRVEAVDPNLRRPGRFEQEMELSVPNVVQRLAIVHRAFQFSQHSLTPEQISRISDKTHGFVGSDLHALVREASHHALSRAAATGHNSEGVVTNDTFLVSFSDVEAALVRVRPSALRSIMVDIPKVRWTDIGGMESLKQELKESVEWPLRHTEAFQRLGIRPVTGLLLYGPPGCSKTLMARAMATESGLNFISVKGPELFNKFLGESERAVRELFRKAKTNSPCIVFFDEIDAIGAQRSGTSSTHGAEDRVLAQLLTEMDGVEGMSGVIVVAATNRPDLIDKALTRPGRFDRLVYVPLPDAAARREIFSIQFKSMPTDESMDREGLVLQTEGYSGAEIVALCRDAAFSALRESLSATSVGERHFNTAMKRSRPRTSLDMIQRYDSFHSRHSGSDDH